MRNNSIVSRSTGCICLAVLAVSWAAMRSASGQDFAVTPSGLSAYIINGQSNPTLTLQRGVTYVFSVSASFHPFYIKTAPGSIGTGNVYTNGVTGNGVQNGALTFAVPLDAPNPLYYHCSTHATMGGMLTITNPPAPPTVRIVFISVSNNVVIKSTGATNWSAIPEYTCAIGSTNWTPVASFTNTLANNTNTTTFNRLDAICGSNTVLRIRNQRN